MPAFVIAGLSALSAFLFAIFKWLLDYLVKLVTKRGLALSFYVAGCATAFGLAYAAIEVAVNSIDLTGIPYANYLTAVMPSNTQLFISSVVGIEAGVLAAKWAFKILELKTDAMMR
jgi:hypothetical protein